MQSARRKEEQSEMERNGRKRCEKTIAEAANLLKQASDMLLSVKDDDTAEENDSETHQRDVRPRSSSSSSRRPASADGARSWTNSREALPSPSINVISETLSHARSMMETSSSAGLYRRLNKNERLRAAPKSGQQKNAKARSKEGNSAVSRPFEFALISCSATSEDSSDDSNTLSRDMILERGMVTLDEKDNEDKIRGKLVSALDSKYSMIGKHDFEFIKVTQKKISVLQLGRGTEYNFNVVKKLAGQGQLYIRMKEEYQFLIDQEDFDDDVLLTGAFDGYSHDPKALTGERTVSSNPDTRPQHSQAQAEECTVSSAPDVRPSRLDSVEEDNRMIDLPGNNSVASAASNSAFIKILNECPSNLQEPTEILRYMQAKIVTGRQLDATDPSVELAGDTNYITVDRENVLSTTIEELKDITDPRMTFQVQFYGEQAVDSGGPRKEWLQLCQRAIYSKYFEHGLKEHLATDYFYVGQLIAISMLQNGPLPNYLQEDVLTEIFFNDSPSVSQCIKKLHEGLDTLAIRLFTRRFPMMLHLFRSTPKVLTVKMLLYHLKPSFSEEGSNSLIFEKAVYGKLVKYMREVAAGRRVTTMEGILSFVTGASEEPILGFGCQPSIVFTEATFSHVQLPDGQEEPKSQTTPNFFPKSSTCSNTLYLPRGTLHIDLPPDETLFNVYDYAFCNTYFGKM